ncbi:30S ribosomal protein S17 [Candidatus Bathyarchaeota archaeon]|nr:30S ribosomal protein S17 [Candidatus Bathyarchaeota archaeon]
MPAITLKKPKASCDDVNCPFHGKLSVRGKVLEGVVVSDKMDKTVIVRRDYLHYVPKYMRYERRHSRIPAHNPPCINAKTGDKVRIMECRPISKTVAFVVVEKLEEEKGGGQG